jgi:hypothetical protein
VRAQSARCRATRRAEIDEMSVYSLQRRENHADESCCWKSAQKISRVPKLSTLVKPVVTLPERLEMPGSLGDSAAYYFEMKDLPRGAHPVVRLDPEVAFISTQNRDCYARGRLFPAFSH